jgi:hypothetical protein
MAAGRLGALGQPIDDKRLRIGFEGKAVLPELTRQQRQPLVGGFFVPLVAAVNCSSTKRAPASIKQKAESES